MDLLQSYQDPAIMMLTESLLLSPLLHLMASKTAIILILNIIQGLGMVLLIQLLLNCMMSAILLLTKAIMMVYLMFL